MSMRKPIVADVAGYAKEVIEDAQCGFVTEDRTVAELSDYIIKLAQDKQLRNRLGRMDINMHFEHYAGKQILKLY